ncbi:MAG: hypothetical protein HOO06_10610 [Bdellovibrionaceae bacterium]|jgi:hypothetical protein|nr:hypothetical protein [Pseudobdellovibrionaceae bacterium]
MKTLNLKGFEGVSTGDRASVYQYVSELEEYFLPNTQVTLLLSSMGVEEVNVEISVESSGGVLISRGSGVDLMEAVRVAKDQMLAEFIGIQRIILAQQEQASVEIEPDDEDETLEYKKENWH